MFAVEQHNVRNRTRLPAHLPTGVTYSDATVRRLAAMKTAAPDFRLFWDNAYGVQHLTENRPAPHDILGLTAEAGNPDRAFIFASTSKITLAGAGLAFFAGSKANVVWYLDQADEEVQSAMGLVDEASYQDLFGRYVQHVTHAVRRERLLNPVTGQLEEPDRQLMLEVERFLEITDPAEDFRHALMARIGAWSIDHPGPDVPVPSKLGFVVGASVNKGGKICIQFGLFGGLPLPRLELGDLSE